MVSLTNPFARVSEVLDIKTASLSASQSNDLLPPRHEDRVSGEVGKRFWESLARALERGEYEPVRAQRVAVPKAGFTSRPAALLALDDRVVFEALVAQLRPRIEAFLVSSDAVMWPRASATTKSWAEFEHAPLEVECSHVVIVDVAGFYESVRHTTIERLATEATGLRDVADAVLTFLDRCMGSETGLPQGAATSDTLATLYLTPADRVMLQAGFDYWRHGDDIRVAVSDFGSGRQAVAVFEDAVRDLGLFVNGSKTRILKRDTYEYRVAEYEVTKTQLRTRLEEARLQQIESGDLEAIAALARAVGIPEESLEWFGNDRDSLVRFVADWHAGLGPYEWLSPEEAIEVLSEVVEAGDTDVARAMFDDAIAHQPIRAERWPRERFHAALNDSLTTLAASRDPHAIGEIPSLLTLYPDESAVCANYLGAVAAVEPDAVAAVVTQGLQVDRFQHGWQAAWLYRVAHSVPAASVTAVTDRATADVSDEDVPWIRRAAAAQVAAAFGLLDRSTLWRLWRRAPTQFQVDLVASAVFAGQAGADWATPFLDGCKGNRVFEVVMQHLAPATAA